jgi:urease accessory protein
VNVTTRRVAPLLGLGLAFWPGAALAHVPGGEVAGLVSGLLHPISGLDHVVAMLAVGLWGAQLGAPALWLLPITFPVVMALGGMLGLLGLHVPGVELGIALSAVALGIVVLCEARPPAVLAAALVAVLAVFHGHAHGTELPEGASGLLYSLGFVVATGAIHAVGIAIGFIHRWTTGSLALRVAGAGVTAAGLLFLVRGLV